MKRDVFLVVVTFSLGLRDTTFVLHKNVSGMGQRGMRDLFVGRDSTTSDERLVEVL